MMKKKVWIIAAVVIVVVGVCVLMFASRIRTVLSVAKSAGMSEEDISAISEENTRIEQSVREQYAIPELDVGEDIRDALADGSMTLEQAAQMLLETQSDPSGQTPPSDAAPETSGIPPESSDTTPETSEMTPGLSGTTPSPSNQTSPSDTTPPNQAPPSDTLSTGWANETPPESVTPPSADGNASNGAPPQTGQTSPPDSVTPPSSDTAPAPSNQTPPSDTAPETSTEPVTEPEISEEQRRIQNLVTQMYVLRGTFTSRVDEIVSACIAEFLALDPSEQTTASKIRIVSARLDEVADLEEDCDRQVADIVAQLNELDPDLAAQVDRQYKNEKELKKAQLVDQYS